VVERKGIGIGVIADSVEHLLSLQKALREQNYEITVACRPDENLRQVLQEFYPDAWVVCLSPHFDDDDAFDLIFDKISQPLLLDETHCSPNGEIHDRWIQRVLTKLAVLVVGPRIDVVATPQREVKQSFPIREGLPEHVWVLGASLGGPEAVVEFLQNVPADLPITFVYAQHIDSGFVSVLADVITKNTSFDVAVLKHGDVMGRGQVKIVPVDGEIRFLTMGRAVASGRRWSGPYSPAISQIMAEISEIYGKDSGAILFSGMGDDGALASNKVQSYGGQLWLQTPESCVCSGMVDATRNIVEPNVTGNPADLAKALVARYNKISEVRG
jgi:chemosensory pili system protein ChpB (putative protein-glutamate methylesterase)